MLRTAALTLLLCPLSVLAQGAPPSPLHPDAGAPTVASPSPAPAERVMPPAPEPLTLLDAVSATLTGVEGELANMPFFVRPMVRGGFSKRTGLALDDWKELLQTLRREVQGGATPAQVVKSHPELAANLERLAENHRTAPERAKKGMGAEGEKLRELQETARQREAAVKALHAWLTGPAQ